MGSHHGSLVGARWYQRHGKAVSMEIDFDDNGGGSVPSIVFKQNFYFTYFMKLFWSRATREATNHFRKDPVS